MQPSSCSVECILGELGSHCATNTASAIDVGIGASFVRGARVVQGGVLDKDLDVDLIQVFRNAKEASSKVLGGLDHAVLRFCTEHGQRACLGEVVEQLTVQFAVRNTQEKVLAASKRCEELST